MKGSVALLIAGIGALLWWEPGIIGLKVNSVEVGGGRCLPETVSETISSEFVGRTMGISTCRSLERAFVRHPLIEKAQADRKWLDTIEIIIEEKELVARVANPEPAVLDVDGIAYTALCYSDSLPLLENWQSLDMEARLQALRLIQAVRKTRIRSFRFSRVCVLEQSGCTELKLEDSGLRLILPSMPNQALVSRLSYVPTVVSDSKSRGENPSSIDLRWSNQIVLGFQRHEDRT